jgi:fatty-acyl-CoA synthase
VYIGHHAATTPDKPAVVMAGSGEVVTFGQLYERSNRLARVLRAAGLRPDDHYAVLAENHVRYFEVLWAGLNSGLHVTPVNPRLTPAEAAYIVADCGARAVVTTRGCAELARAIVDDTPGVPLRLMIDGTAPSHASYEDAVAGVSGAPLEEERRGTFMFYSSGTTGRPKGIAVPLPDHPASEGDAELLGATKGLFGFEPSDVYLSPAPMYHAAPARTTQIAQCLGVTVVCMERFDALGALQAIERHGVTTAQFVPTMFVRMLKLDEAERRRVDVSSLRVAVHAAAPCPVAVKERMIEWWGPILFEYYAGSENFGMTAIDSADWLAHKGSVGRSFGSEIHVCDADGRELAPGEDGLVYFATPGAHLEYHGDPEKTASAHHPRHADWRTLGDIGHLDTEGYLYLTDRATFMIISGGVNVYPQEVEDALITHPAVLDVAVIGVPDEEMGEQVKAVVQPQRWEDAGPALAAELIEHCRAGLAHYKCPRSVDFDRELPRLDNGKLYKRTLRDRYWPDAPSRIVT